MGEFTSGKWIIGLLIYFFVFFIVMWSVLNAQAAIGETTPANNRVEINDPGFQDRLNSFDLGARCSGKSSAVTFLDNVLCKDLNVHEHEPTCNNVTGCIWKNGTSLFNITIIDAGCTGNMNKTFYNVPDKISSSSFCETSTFSTEELCKTMDCTWVNESQLALRQVDPLDKNSLVTMWQTIKFVATFRADLGLGGFTFIFSFMFFWIEFVMLIWALYMAIPWLH